MAKKRRDRQSAGGAVVAPSVHEEPLREKLEEESLTKDTPRAPVGSARMSLLILLSIFTCSASVMYLVYSYFPELNDDEMEKIKIPKDMDDAKALGVVLSKYKDTYYTQVLMAYFTTPVVYRYLSERAQKWSQQVDKHRKHLINYIIFLRITPFLPNWFINITSPVINVPLGVFFLGTFLGVAPPSFVAINAGTTLYKLTTAGEAVSWNSLGVLAVLAVLSILPVCFQKKLQEKLE
ncbi:hypothetical protein NHX12_005359 [Muraenolepis orangiensis]|uniref:Transmembrane protein 41B n=1 Tax=Muraenolepis orangiensis TaxID=630683 RepID=A0A9Q0IDM2_9TELE|nr:hypothetical protein NHX12_005359 [Muraenolepis orangiensis]